ncbi:hypothetical protein KEM54_001145 [Ascosphaera aggregata]|nr:hypothetical protein KEM54_001145 [Ascosphaera aggregata]
MDLPRKYRNLSPAIDGEEEEEEEEEEEGEDSRPANSLPGHDAALLAAVLSSDDEGSSGLSEIDVNLDTDQLDDEAMSLALNLHTDGIIQSKRADSADNDSEAETERIGGSVDQDSNMDDGEEAATTITPSEHAHTKSAKRVDGLGKGRGGEAEAEEEEEEQEDDEGHSEGRDDSAVANLTPNGTAPNGFPTTISTQENGDAEAEDDGTRLIESHTSTDLKRKRSESPEKLATKTSDDEPSRKRRGSITSKTDKLVAESQLRIPGSPLKRSETVPEKSPIDYAEEDEDTTIINTHSRTRKGKRTKRRTRSSRHNFEDRRNGSPSDEYTSPEHDGSNVDGDTSRDTETIVKSEMEAIRKKASAMDALSNLEKQFMLMKDRVYDERIGNYQKEIDQLINHPEEHAEYQEYISMITANRQQKEEYEKLLLGFRIKSLCVKSEVDRLRIHSSYYQNVRDVREKHLDDIAAMHYRLTQDRFQSSKICPDYVIPFPTRRSQQIAQQAAYNKEVSILAGFAKYVGFPAAPEIMPAKPHECEEDLEKMGVRFERLAPSSVYPSSSSSHHHHHLHHHHHHHHRYNNRFLPAQQHL